MARESGEMKGIDVDSDNLGAIAALSLSTEIGTMYFVCDCGK